MIFLLAYYGCLINLFELNYRHNIMKPTALRSSMIIPIYSCLCLYVALEKLGQMSFSLKDIIASVICENKLSGR